MYVRVQLSEEPAWLRGGSGDEVLLLEEARSKKESETAGNKDEEADTRKDLQDLSLERGDAALGPSGKRVEIGIVEKAPSSSTPAPPSKADEDGGTVEGYKPRKELLDGKKPVGDDEEDDDDDDDEDLLESIKREAF